MLPENRAAAGGLCLAGLPPFERETALGRLKTAQQRRIGVPVGDDAGLLMAM